MLNFKIVVVSQSFLLLFPLIAVDLRPIIMIVVYYCIILFQQEQYSKVHMLVEVPTVTCCSSWSASVLAGQPSHPFSFLASSQYSIAKMRSIRSRILLLSPSPSPHMTSLTVPISPRYVSGAFQNPLTIRYHAVGT